VKAKQKKRSRPNETDPDAKHFAALAPYIDKVTVGGLRRGGMFSLCVKASLAKCYEFNMLVRRNRRSDDAFFWLPALRGICEDLIVLNFLGSLPKSDREALVPLLMTHEVYSRIESQEAFFSAVRPQQPVLSVKDAKATLTDTERKIQAIWNRHGWPNLKHGTLPQIRQIAEKQGQSVLSHLYDYLYRLTSGTVHFTVQSLLRSGWGEAPKRCKFSTANFQPYFSEFSSVYGAFLFCVYFEFFHRTLHPDRRTSRTVAEIRKVLILSPRWPEMVTFEEMNLRPPKSGILMFIYSAIQAEQNKKLIKR
jgi:hypothetical protein